MKGSAIEWTDHTFNAWEGCTKVSTGCANCYAEARNHRFAQGRNWGPGAPRRRTAISNWQQVPGWNKQAACGLCGAIMPISDAIEHRHGSIKPALRRVRVFCNSLADLLDHEVPIEWLADLLKLIHNTPNLDWLALSKRIHLWRPRLMAVREHVSTNETERDALLLSWLADWLSGFPPDNVWIGTTIEDQQRADERIPELLKIPAKVRFLSVEPMLEVIEFSDVTKRADWKSQLGKKAFDGIDWVICGGESGPKKRAFHCDWARSLRDQCKAAGVPFFFKQVDKVRAIPEDLLIREFPSFEKPQPEGVRLLKNTN